MKPVLILGLGNPLQADDGIGCCAAEALEKLALPDNVQVLDGGTPGVGLINLFEGRERVILIDAAEMGRDPGTVVRFRPEDVALTGSVDRFSLHRSGVTDSLSLAWRLGIPLPEIVVFGVQPARVGWSAALSPAGQAAIPRVVDAVLTEIGVHHGK